MTGRVKRVGHKGADAIEPGNTPASFDAALAAGVDMIEFDVLPLDWREPETTPLVLAHDYMHDLSGAFSLEDGLAHLAGPAFDGIELDVDLKVPGYERRVVEALREHDLVERTLVSSQFMRSLAAVRELEPRLRLGWSVPRAKHDYTRSILWMLPALAMLSVLKRTLPRSAAKQFGAGRADAIMVHYRLVSPALIRVVEAAGAETYVWTVDDAATIGAMEALGVTGIITNDPRLFSAARTAPR
jgi:glycerophosphoryl diester phosphodiesterase